MIILSLIFWLVGLALLGGGIWLITLDGSWYYALAGIVLIVVGALTRSRRPTAQMLYALFLIATAAWSLWESGYDWWPLATRLGLFLVLAIPLLIPAKGAVAPAWPCCCRSGRSSVWALSPASASTLTVSRRAEPRRGRRRAGHRGHAQGKLARLRAQQPGAALFTARADHSGERR